VTDFVAPTAHEIFNPDGLQDFTLTWTPIEGAVEYWVQHIHDGVKVVVKDVFDAHLNVNGARVGENFFRVLAVDANGKRTVWGNQVSTIVVDDEQEPPPPPPPPPPIEGEQVTVQLRQAYGSHENTTSFTITVPDKAAFLEEWDATFTSEWSTDNTIFLEFSAD